MKGRVPEGRARVRVEFVVRISDPRLQALAEDGVMHRLSRMRVVSDTGLVESFRVVGLHIPKPGMALIGSERICGCGHTEARHRGPCNGTLAELDLLPGESDQPPESLCECTEFGVPD